MRARVRAAMGGPLHLEDENRCQVEDALRPHLAADSSLAAALERVEEVLGELRFDLETGIYAPERRSKTIAELEKLRTAAERAGQAADLDGDASTALYFAFYAPGTPWTLDGQDARERLRELRRITRMVARDAYFAVARLRDEPPQPGRPRAEAERRAVRALMDVWEEHTGCPPTFHGGREDGGPCLAFMNSCIRALPGLGGFNGKRLFRELLKASKTE